MDQRHYIDGGLKATGFVEYLASCECGMSGMILGPPSGPGVNVNARCPSCGEEATLVEAPRPEPPAPPTRWQRWTSRRMISHLLALASILIVVGMGLSAIFLTGSALDEANFRAIGYSIGWVVLYIAWWLRE